MRNALAPPQHVLPVIQHILRERFPDVIVTQAAGGDTIASIQGIDIGSLGAAVLWLGEDTDAHRILREIAYHLLFVAPGDATDFPIVAVERFSDDLRRHLAYEGRFPMRDHPNWNWLVISLDGDLAGWFHNREITTLPTPRPLRASTPAFHVGP